MALIACISDIEITWHVGEGKLSKKIPASTHVVIQADGDELYHISHCIDGIRFNRRAKVNIWTGEDAMFIINNLE